MKCLNFILTESGLELVPKSLIKHPAVLSYAKKRGRKPEQTLLDRSIHHSAMHNLPNALKRGRPDITHLTLLNILNSPLNKKGIVKVYVHTIQDKVIDVDSKVRLPKNYNRFIGLMEQLFSVKKVPPKGQPLLTLREQTISQLIKEINPSKVIAFTTLGKPVTLQEVCNNIVKEVNPTVLVGGFPHSHFSEETLKLASESVKVYSEALEAWIIAARLIYSCELALGITF
ncbi:16S rRNA methyltransferase [Candidatus Bathyarchaeota archaeon]|nr:16S rRNA methyltransferase [Candidatus Bathyarchaeota archaeon]